MYTKWHQGAVANTNQHTSETSSVPRAVSRWNWKDLALEKDNNLSQHPSLMPAFAKKSYFIFQSAVERQSFDQIVTYLNQMRLQWVATVRLNSRWIILSWVDSTHDELSWRVDSRQRARDSKAKKAKETVKCSRKMLTYMTEHPLYHGHKWQDNYLDLKEPTQKRSSQLEEPSLSSSLGTRPLTNWNGNSDRGRQVKYFI